MAEHDHGNVPPREQAFYLQKSGCGGCGETSLFQDQPPSLKQERIIAVNEEASGDRLVATLPSGLPCQHPPKQMWQHHNVTTPL